MSSSTSSNNGLIQKNGGFAITLAKINKQAQDPFEMNSINSAILLNPTTIKTNHPVINHLYTPILGQARSDTIDLSAISINTFSNNSINPLLLNSFQNLQPNKFHPYIRSNNAGNFSNQTTVIKSRSNNYRLNGQQSSGNSTGTSTSSTSSNNYIAHSLRLSEELNSNLAQNIIKQTANSYPSIDSNHSNSSRLTNDSSLNNWLANGQVNQLNNNQYLSTNSSQFLSSRNNQLNKRSRVGNNNKSTLYSDKNAVDSVKKLDKILLSHNKNLQEIIRHKNQLIDQLNRRSNNSSSQINNHQVPVNRTSNSKQQLSFQQQTSLVNTNGNNAKALNKAIYSNGNNIANLSNNLIYSQLSNNISQQINQLNQLHNSAKLILNNNKKLLRVNESEPNLNKGLNSNNLVFNNNSLSVLTRAINEEAELNKQKQEKSNQIDKRIEDNREKNSIETNAKTVNSNAAKDSNQVPVIKEVQQERELVSKLDEREVRLKKIREEEPNENEIFFINNGDLEDYYFGDDLEECLTDIELDDEYDYRLKSMSTIFNTGKASPDLTQEKLSYLNLVGLTTEQNKEKLEFEKFIRTKRNLKEISNVEANENSKNQSSRSQTLRSYSTRNQSRLLKEANKSNNSIEDYDFGNEILTKSKDLVDDLSAFPDKSGSFDIFNEFVSSIANRKIDNVHLKPSEVSPLIVRDSSNDQKLNFMDQIGLIIENDVENIKSKELFWNGILDDRERRKIFETCFEDLTDNLDPSTKQRWLSELSERSLNDRAFKGSGKSRGGKNRVNNNVQSVNKVENVCHQKYRNSSYSRELEVKSTNLMPCSEIIMSEEDNIVSKINTSDELLDHSDYFRHDKQDQSLMKWPGVETVLRSYQMSIREMEVEKLRLGSKFKEAQENKIQKLRELEALKMKKNQLIKDKNELISDELKMRKLLKSNESYYTSLKRKLQIS